MTLRLSFKEAMKLCRLGYNVKSSTWEDDSYVYSDNIGFLYTSKDNQLYSPKVDDILETEWYFFKKEN